MSFDLKARLQRHEPTVGSWITLGHPAIAEIMADAGFDWLVIDLEHSTIDLKEAQELIRAIDTAGVTPLVRLSGHDPSQAKRVLDAGARGIIVPMINTAAEAQAAVRAARYPPAGARGVGLARAQRYGLKFEEYVRAVEPETVVVAQIEHIDGVAALETILAVPGIDATIIGPYDLSASAGKPGQFDDPSVRARLDRYEAVSKAAGVPIGFHVIDPGYASVVKKLAEGYRFIAYSVDFLFLGQACRSGLADLRTHLSAHPL